MSGKFPVLLLLFNRPDLTEGLVEKLRCYAPEKLYIAIDGPRASREEEAALCRSVREITEQKVDWPCQKEWLVRNANLGCGPGVKGALDWFFQQEEAGIILEDDCHPSPDFFRFVSTMLAAHRDREEIFLISGNDFIPDGLQVEGPLYLSKYTSIWGWATWRRSWNKYQFTYPEIEREDWEKIIRESSSCDAEACYWLKEFHKLFQATVPHTWDIQLQFSVWKNGAKNIFPSRNLVTNHGLRGDATHTREFNERLFKKSLELPGTLPLKLPSYYPTIDSMLFWFHQLEGNPERFKYLLMESDADWQKRLFEMEKATRSAQHPGIKDVAKVIMKWLLSLRRSQG